MAISKLQPVVTSSINASAITCTSPNILYGLNQTFNPGVYTITCVNTTIARVAFFSNVNTLITTATTVSGTVTINLGTTADRIRVWTDTGSSVVVTITLTASSLTSTFSGTLDTITTTGTYTGTSASGYAYVLGVAGGGGGGGTNPGQGGGQGGIAGSVYYGIIPLTGNLSITIGNAGSGGAASTNGTAGGNTIIGSTTLNGGSGGAASYYPSNYRGLSGDSVTTIYSFITGSSTIGTGGGGADDAVVATSGSGYGAGGGGGAASNVNVAGRAGANGRPGAVYILKF